MQEHWDKDLDAGSRFVAAAGIHKTANGCARPMSRG